MKQSDIQVGKFYCNRGKGMVIRHVIDINFMDTSLAKVKYMAMDITGNQTTTYHDTCFLDQFAKWAGAEVEI